MISKRDKLISDCVKALSILNKEAGYTTISRQTLHVIMDVYAKAYNAPDLPDSRRASVPAKPMPNNVVNMFGNTRSKAAPVRQTRGDIDFADARRAHEANEKRLRAQRASDNDEVKPRR